MEGTSKIPAAIQQYITNDKYDVLPDEKAQLFHYIVAKLLFLCRHTKKDIQMVVAFLCTRAKRPDKDNYKKLTRVMHLLQATQDLTLTIEPDYHQNSWVNSGMRSHSRIYMTQGELS